MALRWILCLCLGLITWVLFDPLPPAFFWVVIVTMLGSMSLHSILHQKRNASGWAKQAARFAFFLSFPMLFIFAGNRLAVWSVTDANTAQIIVSGIPSVQGVIASEEYLLFKDLQKEGFKDLIKSKKGFKKILGKKLAKFKEVDKTARILLIVLGVVLLLVIIFLIAIFVSINQSVDSCLGSDTSNDGCI